jgi:RNA polymerase sigma-70 factor (ECF subfamily)
MMSDKELTDEQLMRRFRRSLDEAAFRVLADRHYDRALRIAFGRLGDRTAAEDAVQEALVRVVRNRRRYRAGKPFAPWFHTILRNVCTDIHRSELRRRRTVAAFQVMAPETVPDTRAREHAHALVDSLPPAAARLLRLRYENGFTFAELARELGCSVEAAKKRVQRVLGELRGR